MECVGGVCEGCVKGEREVTLSSFWSPQMAKWLKFDKAKMPIMDALLELDKIIDESDPDVRRTFNLE